MYPGESIGSGTVGFGCGKELDRWIKPGDVVELEVEGIGILRNRVERRLAHFL
jgi:2-keto-4-pentenoate hydratase/2-oxohepta-3-ene-1,7-dioic acid hydratase in catechol pathway